ncbi:cytochrome P450 [Aquabacter cavernae]|uniref:cytochrome P450 n=1 Tax=Aquabacter cavernae TaxID=2496029 RepID=UPI000F8EF626|nr:cytochrome P450 [Aquabacter cavernae]
MKHWFSDLIAFQRDPLRFFEQHGRAAREPLVPLSMGPYAVMLVADPELIKPIMKAEEAVIDKGKLIFKLREIIGKSSMTLSGEAHRARRAALHHQLARGLATTYVPQIAALARAQAAALACESEFDAHHATSRLTLRVICNILFGPGVLSSGDENALCEAIKLVEDDLAADIFKVLPDLPWVAKRKKARMQSGRDMMMMVVERARKRAASASVLRALEDLDLTSEEMGDEVLLLLLAGHHTTGTAAAWLLWHLARDPALAERLAQEAQSISDAAGELRPDRLPSAPVSLAFTREVLRLYPSAWWLSREVKAPIELGGRKLKPGTSLLISPWHMHRDPRFWASPEEFRLDRKFSGPAYLPFGAGPRACVGMGVGMLELQILALEFASAYELEAADIDVGAPHPSITLVPPPIHLRIRSRVPAASDMPGAA